MFGAGIAFMNQSGGAQTKDYSDVLVIINVNSPESVEIGEYFAARRHIPDGNLCRIQSSTDEEINDDEFQSLRSQIEHFLIYHHLADKINYLVTTKGVPLKVNRGARFSEISPSASVESELTLILSPWSKCIGRAGRIYSPYFNAQSHFSHKEFGIYLVTRLDGYTVKDVKQLIQNGEGAKLVGRFLFDCDPSLDKVAGFLNDDLRHAATQLEEYGMSVTLDDSHKFLTRQDSVLGYVSWGSNDMHWEYYTDLARPHNQWLPGAIAETYVSTSARSFEHVLFIQSQIADLIREGVTGVKGYVYEPFASAMAHVDILFDRYTSGYNLAESFFAASWYLSWQDVVVGDPKVVLEQSSEQQKKRILAQKSSMQR